MMMSRMIRWVGASFALLMASRATPGSAIDIEFSAKNGEIYVDNKPFYLKGVNWFGFGMWKSRHLEM